MNLLLDTETSNLWHDDLPLTAPEQPHLVQLGAKLFDRQWKKRGHLTVLIKPDGWEITPEAEGVHGISTHICHRYGIPIAEALVAFRGLVMASNRIIGHHVQFDRKVIQAACHRAGGEGLWWSRLGHKMFCTMESSTDVCQLPSDFGGYKWPTLEEAVAILLPGETWPVTHDAETDIDATAAVYRELIKRGVAQEADPFANLGRT